MGGIDGEQAWVGYMEIEVWVEGLTDNRNGQDIQKHTCEWEGQMQNKNSQDILKQKY